MFKKILFAVCMFFVTGAGASAQKTPSFDPRLAGSPVYSDPGFQEFIETSYGYLNPRNKVRPLQNLRDSVASPSAETRKPAAAKTEKYAFVSIQPRYRDYSGLLGELSASGFVLSGERTVHSGKAKKTRLVGWVREDGLAAIRRNPGVAGVRLVRKAGRASFIRARGF